ncbi:MULTISPECIES: hypothetical protein [unclassified Endozoicomonas]|uniref:hypothetical protein n=1 Tax=unclassified Endozoicomonas TaxID=2644528 RepID=UPI002148BBE0|nr:MULTISPECIES: hypothetical protein [unclassified Endozoicomonas]
MKNLLKGAVFILAILGLGFTVANEMDLFEEQNNTDSAQFDFGEEDLHQNETTSYPEQDFESEGEVEYEVEDREYDDDEYNDDSDEDESVIEEGY